MITTITDILVKYGVAYRISSAMPDSCRIRVIDEVESGCVKELLANGLEKIIPVEVSDMIFEFKH